MIYEVANNIYEYLVLTTEIMNWLIIYSQLTVRVGALLYWVVRALVLNLNPSAANFVCAWKYVLICKAPLFCTRLAAGSSWKMEVGRFFFKLYFGSCAELQALQNVHFGKLDNLLRSRQFMKELCTRMVTLMWFNDKTAHSGLVWHF